MRYGICAIAALVLVSVGARAKEYPGELSPLVDPPRWEALDRFQGTITQGEFTYLLESVFAPRLTYRATINMGKGFALIKKYPKSPKWNTNYRLNFRSGELPPAETKELRYWRTRKELLSAQEKGDAPLKGVRILLDPGHLGGEWAKMEERWFQLDGGKPVAEGDMTLSVARHIRKRLEKLGATVLMTRDSSQPVTPERPDTLENEAMKYLKEQLGATSPQLGFKGATDPKRMTSIRWWSELLFYRSSEIRWRGRRVNEEIKPDMALCIHFNAESWGDPAHPRLTKVNHVHILINGTYLQNELEKDDQRYEMLLKLLNRSYYEEVGLAKAMGNSFKKATGLRPYTYFTPNASSVEDTEHYVWSRNLLANRLYECPTVFLEPYVMNGTDVYERIQAGDYEGVKMIGGKERKSLFREYADAVVEGVKHYYAK